jgi:Ca2+-binding EF-hand superfamily protein
MHARWRATFGLAGILVLAGCGTRESSSAAGVSPKKPRPAATVSSRAHEELSAAADPPDEVSPAAGPATEAGEAPRSVEKEIRSTPDGNGNPPERIALLTPGGPLLADVRLAIDGRSHNEVFETNLERFLEAGETDGDGQTTWKELAANRKFVEAELPGAPPADSRQMKSLIDRYDENGNGRIERGEAATWLGRDAGVSASAISVRSSRSYRPIPHVTSHIWQLLDSDGNGRLSTEEIARAPDALWSFDSDDDRTISHAELLSLREQLEAAGPRRMLIGYQAEHYAAIHLAEPFQANRLDYLLNDLYATRQVLEASSFASLPDLFPRLDANGDGAMAPDELARLQTIDPHLELSIAYDTAAGRGMEAVKLEFQELAPEIHLVAQPSADRVVLSLGNTRLVVSAQDLGSAQGANQTLTQAAQRAQVRAMIHDQCDALFEALDKNADGRLGEREIATCTDRFSEWDANQDAWLNNNELPYCMVVAFLLGERPTEQSFYVPTFVSAASASGSAPAWFAAADLNRDGDLSRREFIGAPEQFLALDANDDGYIEALEAAALQTNQAPSR